MKNTWSFTFDPDCYPADYTDHRDENHENHGNDEMNDPMDIEEDIEETETHKNVKYIYTDGSVCKSKKFGTVSSGIGIVEICGDEIVKISSNHGGSDINIVEADAIILYLSGYDNDKNMHIAFVVDTDIIMTRIFKKYRSIETNTKTYQSQEIQKRVDIIVELLAEREGKTTFNHVHSHNGNYGNILADTAARYASQYLKNKYVEVEYNTSTEHTKYLMSVLINNDI